MRNFSAAAPTATLLLFLFLVLAGLPGEAPAGDTDAGLPDAVQTMSAQPPGAVLGAPAETNAETAPIDGQRAEAAVAAREQAAGVCTQTDAAGRATLPLPPRTPRARFMASLDFTAEAPTREDQHVGFIEPRPDGVAGPRLKSAATAELRARRFLR